jgi:OPT family oligopeptide transporter
MNEQPIQTRLPENAYRELKPGERYMPMVPASANVPEVTRRSIIFGIVMNIIFSMAASYLALKVGQGIETAIPISILAVGLSGFLVRFGKRRSSLLENVNILAISTTSGIVAGGTVFTMPAIYLLKLNESLHLSNVSLFLQIFLVPMLGAVLGVVFLVPFRGYFVRVMHGKLPFPEGTATNEILATGASEGGGQAWVLIYSFLFAMLYNFASGACRLFRGIFTSGEVTLKAAGDTVKALALKPPGRAFEVLEYLTYHVKAVFQMGTGAEYLGLGFIIGLRYATIICCGSFLSCFVIVPLFSPFTLEALHKLNPAVESTSAADIFQDIPRIIGIGAIFTAGIISILKMSKVIATALKEAIGSLFRSRGDGFVHARTDQDINYPTLLALGLATATLLFLYFRFSVLVDVAGATKLSLLATLVALVLSFLFTTVSAWAIAMISTTPLSGMTVTTIIITAVVLLQGGLPKGDRGMLATLLVGGVVCTALSMAGTMVTEFKIAYWIGATPKKVQWGGIISSVLASVLVTITIMVLAYKPGYIVTPSNPMPLDAPQANLMKSTLASFIGTGNVPWLLYGVGGAVAVIVQMLGVSPLAFGLGMYLPMRINTPILLGAIVQALVTRRSGDELRDKARGDKGILVASGLIAGAAIIDVLTNALAIVDEQVLHDRVMPALDFTNRMIQRFGSAEEWARRNNWLGLLAFLMLSLLVYIDCRRAKPHAAS